MWVALLTERVRRVNHALVDNASQVTHLRRMYVWSVEFGLIDTQDSFSIYGADLISAPTEFRTVCEKTPTLPYCLDIVHYENAFSEMLDQYFVARDFEHLDTVLSEYERLMQVSSVPQRSGIRELVPHATRQGSRHA